MRHRLISVVGALALSAGIVTGPLAGAASAQQYPPRANACRVSVTVVRPGVRVVLTCGGFRPRSIVLVRLFSDPVRLGEFTADADGTAVASVVIPESTPPGEHTLRATGVDPAGRPLEESVAILVMEAGAGSGGGGGAGGVVHSSTGLSRTGTSSTLPLTAAAVGLVGIGAGAVVVGRRRRLTD